MRADALDPEVERELAAIDEALAGRPVHPELADLALLVHDLRDDRTEIDPAFARTLDERVAAGFPREPGRLGRLLPARSSWSAPVAFAATALVVVGVSLTALTRSGDRGAEVGAGGATTAPMTDDRATGGGGEQSGAAAPGSPAVPEAAGGSIMAVPAAPGHGSPRSDRRRERRVERSASLVLTAPPDRIADVGDRIVAVADAVRGFVVSSTVGTSASGHGGGTFELRVPTDRLDQALAQLSALPDVHVRERQKAAQDITAESVSARGRLREARAERASLLRRLSRAETDAETEALRARLRDVSARTRAAKADLARVSNRASFSNIFVALEAEPAGREETGDGVWSPGDALGDARRVLEVAAGVALVALAAALPLVLIGAAVLLARRAVRRRRHDAALDAG